MPRGITGKTSILHISQRTLQILSYAAGVIVRRQPINQLSELRFLVSADDKNSRLLQQIVGLAERCERKSSAGLKVRVESVDWRDDAAVYALLSETTQSNAISSIIMSQGDGVEPFSHAVADYQRDRRSLANRHLPVLPNAPFVTLATNAEEDNTYAGMLANQQIRHIIACSTKIIAPGNTDVISAQPQVLGAYIESLLFAMNHGHAGVLELDKAVQPQLATMVVANETPAHSPSSLRP